MGQLLIIVILTFMIILMNQIAISGVKRSTLVFICIYIISLGNTSLIISTIIVNNTVSTIFLLLSYVMITIGISIGINIIRKQ